MPRTIKAQLSQALVPSGNSSASNGKGGGKGESQRAVRRKKDKEETGKKAPKDPEVCKMMKVVLKSQLQQCQRMRDLRVAALDILSVKSDLPELMCMQAQLAEYVENTTGKPGHGLGPPDVWMWGGLIEALCKRGDKKLGKHFKVIQDYSEVLEDMELEDKVDSIKVVKIEKMFSSEHRRVLFCIREQSIRVAVVGALMKLGATRKAGREAPGALEEQMQMWLDTLDS